MLARVIGRAAMDGASVADLRGTLIALAVVLIARALIGAGFELSGRLGAVAIMSELRARLIRQLLVLRPVGRAADGPRTGELAAADVLLAPLMSELMTNSSRYDSDSPAAPPLRPTMPASIRKIVSTSRSDAPAASRRRVPVESGDRT